MRLGLPAVFDLRIRAMVAGIRVCEKFIAFGCAIWGLWLP